VAYDQQTSFLSEEMQQFLNLANLALAGGQLNGEQLRNVIVDTLGEEALARPEMQEAISLAQQGKLDKGNLTRLFLNEEARKASGMSLPTNPLGLASFVYLFGSTFIKRIQILGDFGDDAARKLDEAKDWLHGNSGEVWNKGLDQLIESEIVDAKTADRFRLGDLEVKKIYRGISAAILIDNAADLIHNNKEMLFLSHLPVVGPVIQSLAKDGSMPNVVMKLGFAFSGFVSAFKKPLLDLGMPDFVINAADGVMRLARSENISEAKAEEYFIDAMASPQSVMEALRKGRNYEDGGATLGALVKTQDMITGKDQKKNRNAISLKNENNEYTMLQPTSFVTGRRDRQYIAYSKIPALGDSYSVRDHNDRAAAWAMVEEMNTITSRLSAAVKADEPLKAVESLLEGYIKEAATNIGAGEGFPRNLEELNLVIQAALEEFAHEYGANLLTGYNVPEGKETEEALQDHLEVRVLAPFREHGVQLTLDQEADLEELGAFTELEKQGARFSEAGETLFMRLPLSLFEEKPVVAEEVPQGHKVKPFGSARAVSAVTNSDDNTTTSLGNQSSNGGGRRDARMPSSVKNTSRQGHEASMQDAAVRLQVLEKTFERNLISEARYHEELLGIYSGLGMDPLDPHEEQTPTPPPASGQEKPQNMSDDDLYGRIAWQVGDEAESDIDDEHEEIDPVDPRISKFKDFLDGVNFDRVIPTDAEAEEERNNERDNGRTD